MGFLKKMKNKVKGFANRFQLDDKLAEEIYNIMRKWDGNTGLKFYERERIDTDDTTYTNAQGEEVEGTEVEVKNEKWKAKIKVPNGKLKLEIEDEGKGRLEVEGKVKKDG